MKKERITRTTHKFFSLFPTAIGTLGIAWNNFGITRIQLPEATPNSTRHRLLGGNSEAVEKSPPSFVKQAISHISRHLSGNLNDLQKIKIDFSSTPVFYKKIYETLRRVPPGETLSYGELAAKSGVPQAARAVGQALAKNPFPLVVPCHRVTTKDRGLGGFSAFGAQETKRKLLALEGVNLSFGAQPKPKTKPSISTVFNPHEAVKILCENDDCLAKLIQRVGPFTLKIDKMLSPFQALFESIVFQQLNGRAAEAILNRVRAAVNGNGALLPLLVLKTSDEKLREAGLSRAKIAAVKDLAEKSEAKSIPTIGQLKKMPDEEIISRLVDIRGIGRWTVEMLLIFRLGRPDVFPVQDYGLRRGFSLAFNRKDLPSPKELAEYGERWRPFRTVASWYLWRATEIISPK